MMDPITIILITQTAIFTLTLIVLIIQVRKQVLATRLEVYSKCEADYSSLLRMLTQQGQLRTIYDDLVKMEPGTWKWETYSDREKILYNYFELNYELVERVFVLAEMGWIESETWKEWEVWLTEVCQHPIFRDVVEDTAGMFYSEFEKYINEKLSNLLQNT